MTYNKTPILLNLNPSEMNEPDISNDEFLESLDMIGVWLRVLSAYDSLESYNSTDSTSAQRLAALSNIYLQLGAQLEDQAVFLIAFSVWSQNRDLVLTNLFSRIFVKRSKTINTESEIRAVHKKLKSDNSKSVPVNQKAFFQEVEELNDVKIVEFVLGYKWRGVPSVKLVPNSHIEIWRNLPEELRRIVSLFHDEKQNPRVTSAYNKLKHGPQLVIQNPINRARCFGVSPEFAAELARYKSYDKPGVRLLFEGARTQQKPVDGTVKSIAPFLIDDKEAVNKIFFSTIVHDAHLFCLLVKMQIALYRKERTNPEFSDQRILQIIEAQKRYLTDK